MELGEAGVHLVQVDVVAAAEHPDLQGVQRAAVVRVHRQAAQVEGGGGR